MKIVFCLIFGSIMLWGFSAYGDAGCRERCGDCIATISKSKKERNACFARLAKCTGDCNREDEERRQSNTPSNFRNGGGSSSSGLGSYGNSGGSYGTFGGSEKKPVVTITEQ